MTHLTPLPVIEDIPPGNIFSQKESALISDFQDALEAIDQTLTCSPYLVSSQFSAADICVGDHLYGCALWPELDAIIQTFPRIISYMKRLKEMPSAIQANVFSYET